MNVNEFGITFRFSTGYGMSAFETLSITFTKPDGSTLTVNNTSTPNAVSLGTVNVTTPDLGVFAANQYANYTFKSGDIDQEGLWTCRLTYTDATPKRLISDQANFTINP